MNKNVCVLGLGYIGLPTAATLASKGYKVSGYDVNESVVAMINQGKIHIVEPGLDHVVEQSVKTGNLSASTAVTVSDVYIICVPTPTTLVGGVTPVPNLKYINEVVDTIAPILKTGDLIILESTSPVGTTAGIKVKLEDMGVQTKGLLFACCPERVIPGNVMIEIVENDRIVGGLTPEATTLAADFYRTFVSGEILQTNSQTAEMAKLAENASRDVNIAFANELSMLCDNVDVDVWELIKLANRHPRVNILQPGPGVGGHCIAVDPWFLVSMDEDHSKLIRRAREVNLSKEHWAVDQVKAVCDDIDKEISDIKVACLGLAFKPDIDDLRESPAIRIVDALIGSGYEVICVEPNLVTHDRFTLLDLDDVFDMADVIVILVKHREFQVPNIKNKLLERQAIDLCGATK
ncbi:MAG: UDP-N-acetyl-D-mannosamine dehydrogenase [Bacteroidetes bacterium]|nr:UDP-N-acetyl-D-mannosamine dehydrogenase [Bacteroidota bacterium]